MYNPEISDEQLNVITRIFEHILNMPENEQRRLLSFFETGTGFNRRSNTRKPFQVPVNFTIGNKVMDDTLADISSGGVYVNSDLNPCVGSEVSLIFSRENFHNLIYITGNVARSDKNGFAVKFNDPNKYQRIALDILLNKI